MALSNNYQLLLTFQQRKTTRHKAFPDGSAHHLGSILAQKNSTLNVIKPLDLTTLAGIEEHV